MRTAVKLSNRTEGSTAHRPRTAGSARPPIAEPARLAMLRNGTTRVRCCALVGHHFPSDEPVIAVGVHPEGNNGPAPICSRVLAMIATISDCRCTHMLSSVRRGASTPKKNATGCTRRRGCVLVALCSWLGLLPVESLIAPPSVQSCQSSVRCLGRGRCSARRNRQHLWIVPVFGAAR